MKPTFQLVITFILIALSTVIISACSTTSTNNNVKFAGTYKVANSCSGDTTTLTISAGNNNSTVYIPISPGTTIACTNNTVLTAQVSGHSVKSIPANFYDNCNHLYSYWVSGTLDSTTLQLTINAACIGVSTVTCNYNSVK